MKIRKEIEVLIDIARIYAVQCHVAHAVLGCCNSEMSNCDRLLQQQDTWTAQE
jgi:hypothetical protein